MARIRHTDRAKSKRKSDGQLFVHGAETPLKPLKEGQVYCPACEQPQRLTPNGRLKPHLTRSGEDCPQRTYGLEVQVDHDEAERMRLEFMEKDRQRPPPLRPPRQRGPDRVATGRCHTCDRAVSGERLYCGPCLSRRI